MGDAGEIELTVGDRLYATAASGVFQLVWWSARLLGVSRDELRCRAGDMPEAQGPLLWFHGASAGEMAAATRLAGVLRHHGYRFTAAYTAANRAGVEFVARLQGSSRAVALAPWDHPRWVRRAFDRWRPAALFLVETELWPHLILEARRRRIPVFCVSARIYPRDVVRYRLIRRFMLPVLRRLTLIVAQSQTERERFIALGAAPDRCVIGGNVKYAALDHAPPGEEPLREELGLGNEYDVVVFGSVHADEIPVVFDALERVRSRALRVIIAPRHQWALSDIVRESRRRNWRLARRAGGAVPPDWQVLVLDRMGELGRAYRIARVGVVGGGFCNHGGHNPIEPLLGGAPVLFGPHFGHFEEEATALATVAPSARVTTALELGERLAEWLGTDERRREILERQRQVVPDGAAVAAAYVTALSPWLAPLASGP